MLSRFQFGESGDRRGYLAVLAILLAVLVPTACLLYFINEAVNSQRRLASQQLSDAYLGQLRLISQRVDEHWQQVAAALDARADSDSPSLFFEHCVRDGLADSVICLDRNGKPSYPSLAALPRADPALRDPQWVEARRFEDNGKFTEASEAYLRIARGRSDPSLSGRAFQSSVRCLLVSGQKAAALDAISRLYTDWHLEYATGLDGRLIVADEFALGMELAGSDSQSTFVRDLFGVTQNYARVMPSAQRLYCMDRLRATGSGRFHQFPTYQAERGAERVLSGGFATPGDAVLALSGIGDLWKLTSPAKRTIALYSTATVISSLTAMFDSSSSRAVLVPPGRPIASGRETVPASRYLPGWRISIAVPAAGVSSDRQIASYIWTGVVTVFAVLVLGALGGQILRRQMRIAHLKTDLVAAVSHELKTPLASMKLLVESLLNGDQFEPKRTRQYLQLIGRENSRLSRVIDNFLTFSRMERNRGRFEFARTSPESIAHAALDSVGDRYHVDLAIDRDLPPVYVDEDAIVTVMLNLLDNAYKYTGETRRIALRISRAEGWVQFSVADNGIGIPEREQKKIFRRFYQIDRRLSRHGGGVGLGLSIVDFIVKAHQGRVAVSSQPGAGSTFTVSLPASFAPVEVAA